MSNRERKQKKEVMKVYVVEEEQKLGRMFPLDLASLIKKKGLDPLCDRPIAMEVLREMNDFVSLHDKKVQETWGAIVELDKGELGEREKYYRENQFNDLVKLVGEENAGKWHTLNGEERWESVQVFCDKYFKCQFRLKHDNDIWICPDNKGKRYKYEDNFRKFKNVSLNQMIRYGKDLYNPDGKNLFRLRGDELELVNELRATFTKAKRLKDAYKIVRDAIVAKERETGSLLDSLGVEYEETETDEDIRKMLKLLRIGPGET